MELREAHIPLVASFPGEKKPTCVWMLGGYNGSGMQFKSETLPVVIQRASDTMPTAQDNALVDKLLARLHYCLGSFCEHELFAKQEGKIYVLQGVMLDTNASPPGTGHPGKGDYYNAATTTVSTMAAVALAKLGVEVTGLHLVGTSNPGMCPNWGIGFSIVAATPFQQLKPRLVKFTHNWKEVVLVRILPFKLHQVTDKLHYGYYF